MKTLMPAAARTVERLHVAAAIEGTTPGEALVEEHTE